MDPMVIGLSVGTILIAIGGHWEAWSRAKHTEERRRELRQPKLMSPEEARRILQNAIAESAKRKRTTDLVFYDWDTDYILGQLRKQAFRQWYEKERADYRHRVARADERYDRDYVQHPKHVLALKVGYSGVRVLDRGEKIIGRRQNWHFEKP